jgi:hypothetical protein
LDPKFVVFLSAIVGLFGASYLNIASMAGSNALGLYIGDAAVIAIVLWAYNRFVEHKSTPSKSLMYVFLAGLIGLFGASYLGIATLLGTGALALLLGDSVLIVVVYWVLEKYLKA